MTKQPNPSGTDKPEADETFTWTGDPAASGGSTGGTHGTDGAGPAGGTGSTSSAGGSPTQTATAVLESLRDAIDDLAERASPTVREYSARAAELAAIAADRAAPFAKTAGEATADASGKLAAKSRIWAADLRASLATPTADSGPATATATATAEAPTEAPAAAARPGTEPTKDTKPATDEPGPA